jgi:hypothetical protein
MLSEFVYEYHGRHMRRIDQAQVEFLFARFAWAVLYLVRRFILMPRPMTRLARYRVWEDGVPRVKELGLPAKDIDMLFSRGSTRSASPRKRSRTPSEEGRGSDREFLRRGGTAEPVQIGMDPTLMAPRKALGSAGVHPPTRLDEGATVSMRRMLIES